MIYQFSADMAEAGLLLRLQFLVAESFLSLHHCKAFFALFSIPNQYWRFRKVFAEHG